jgi:alkylhydroperoxidase family enzyme
MEPLFLKSLERVPAENPFAERFAEWKANGIPIPQILYLFAFRPGLTEHLSRFTQEAMRGPSPLSPGQRELIAAFTSRRNQCPF